MFELWSLFLKGGYVMYPILLCSIISVAIAVERIFFYRKSAAAPAFLPQLKNLLLQHDYAGALELAKENQGDCPRLAENYLRQESKDLSVLESNANLALDSYDEHVIFLDMIVTASPLLGLLGTIFGMISAFKVFDLRAGQPFAITSGIGEALIATAFGLMVALLALGLHCILRFYSDRLVTDIKECCAILEIRKQDGQEV